MLTLTLMLLAASPIDAAFQGWEKKLPAATELSEMNGFGFSCPTHGSPTYTHLAALARALPIKTDADLMQLVPWARAGDECLRHIAVEAILTRLPKFDSNSLSVPSMHDPQHVQFHEVMSALAAHLEHAGVVVDPKVFDGLMMKTTLAEFPALAHHAWVEVIGPQQGFQDFVRLDAKSISVMSRHLPKDPKWPDHTLTSGVKTVTRDEKGIFTVTCEWSQESNARGYQGTKQVPAQFTYSVWPVAPDVMWFRSGNDDWKKFKR